MSLLLYALLTTSLYYLGCRASITERLWSRYPEWLEDIAICPACSGFWYGLACGGLGAWLELPFLGLDPRHAATPIIISLAAIAWTPIIAVFHIPAVEALDPPDRKHAETTEA